VKRLAVFQADALVIRSREYGESDRLLTLFSREHGKLHAVAKGVRKPKSRQRGGTQLFTYADFLLHKGKTLHTVTQASPKESFRHIWDDFERNLAASAMAELLDCATVEGEAYPELFALTLNSFYLLASVEPALLQYAYALRLLDILGYRPELHCCVRCGSPVAGERVALSVDLGGAVCGQCREGIAVKELPAGSVAFMRQLLGGDLAKLQRLRWNVRMKHDLGLFIQAFCEAKFEHALKSWDLKRDILSGEQKPITGGRSSHGREHVEGTGQD